MSEVYWHTRRRLWSVREGGRVVGHAAAVSLVDVTLVVRSAAVARVRLRGQREVCAWASGTRTAGRRVGGGIRLRFDPFEHLAFVTDAGVAGVTCRILHLEADGSAWGAGCR